MKKPKLMVNCRLNSLVGELSRGLALPTLQEEQICLERSEWDLAQQ